MICSSRALRASLFATTAMVVLAPFAAARADFIPGDLLVSYTTYQGTASTVAVGQQLTPATGTTTAKLGKAIADGSYANVWKNSSVDGSFGATSAISIAQITPGGPTINNLGTVGGALVSTLSVPTSSVVTSFSSKSELGLNLSTDGHSVSFVGYVGAGVNNLDVSNSDTPGLRDATNPVTQQYGSSHAYARGITSIDSKGNIAVTPTNAYSGNNGRNAILADNGNYYATGNGNNGGGTPQPLIDHVGVTVTAPSNGALVTPTQVGDATNLNTSGVVDKAGKANNFRGETIFNNTLYVTKGSGSNGINTVYQVGTAGTLPTTANTTTNSDGILAAPISVLPGFSTVSAKNAAPFTPFGIFFANAKTLYVADEGSGDAATDKGLGSHAGLEKWVLVNGTWQLAYTLQKGLISSTGYSVADPTGQGANYVVGSVTGLRNIYGKVNADGTVTIYGATATDSLSGDAGADPNALVSITDSIDATTLDSNETFNTVIAPQYGVRIAGVTATPTPEPATLAVLASAVAGLAAFRRRR